MPVAVPDTTVDAAPVSDLATVRIGLLGFGRIGQAIARRIEEERECLRAVGLDVRCEIAFVRDVTPERRGAPAVPLVSHADLFFDREVDVVVEALGGVEPARALVIGALRRGVPVVTANKSLVAADGARLRRLAADRSTAFRFEAAALAGVPFLGALASRPLFASATRLAGILNGTTHFIVSAMARGESFASALASATALGYAEPDSAHDISGGDASEKLAILLGLVGVDVTPQQLPRQGIDGLTAAHFDRARALGGVIKPAVLAEWNGEDLTAWVGPAFLPAAHELARLDGVTNAIAITGPHGRHGFFAGPGAGPAITAATILDDVVEVALGAGPARPRPSRRPTAVRPPADRVAIHDLELPTL